MRKEIEVTGAYDSQDIHRSQLEGDRTKRPQSSNLDKGGPNFLARRMALGAAVGTLLLFGARGLVGQGNEQGPPTGTGVSDATMNYLRSLPREGAEVPAGGGIDNAAYAVDPYTFDSSNQIHEGIRKILNSQTPGQDGMPQANETLQVPVLPPAESIPPEALK